MNANLFGLYVAMMIALGATWYLFILTLEVISTWFG